MRPQGSVVLFVFLVLLTPALASAGTGDVADLNDLGLDDLEGLDDLGLDDTFALLYAEDIVLSATRHEQRISQSPSTITVISREDLASGAYRDLADVMRTVPGGDVYRFNPMSVTAGIRTGTTSTANQVLVLLDGRDQGLHATGQPIWNALPLDLDSIERVEIIRGPGSSIYGANALQGVVNVIPREPTEAPLALESTISAADPASFLGDVRAHGTHGRLRFWANAGYEQESFFERPGHRGFQTRRARSWVGYTLNDETEARFDLGYSDARGWFISPAGDGPARWGAAFASGRLRSAHGEALLNVESGFGYFAPEVRFIAPATSSGQEPIDLGRVEPIDLRSRSAELIGWRSIEPLPGHRLMFGATGRAIHHRDAVLSCPPDVPPHDFDLQACVDQDLLELRGGLFVQDEWAIADDLALTVGTRLDVNNLHPELGLSPRAALVYAPIEGHAFRAAVGRAYRKPSFFEAYTSFRVDTNPGVPSDIASRLQHLLAVDMPNPGLRNEKVTAAEVGWAGRLGQGRLLANVDLHVSRIDDRVQGIIENVGLEPGLGGVPRLRDDAEVTFINFEHPQWGFGGEVSTTYRPAPWARVQASYSFQRVRFAEEADDGSVTWLTNHWNPEHRAHLGGRATLPVGLAFSVDAQWYSGYARWIQDPESVLLPEISQDLGNMVLVLGGVSWLRAIGDGEIEVGLKASNLLAQPVRELPGVSVGDDVWGGEMLAPRARLFVRGRF